MHEYDVKVHRRAFKFLQSLKNQDLKNRLKEIILELKDYPFVLRRLDVEKLEGLEKTYRVRTGDYRIIFYVDTEERTIYVTHVGKRESIYER